MVFVGEYIFKNCDKKHQSTRYVGAAILELEHLILAPWLLAYCHPHTRWFGEYRSTETTIISTYTFIFDIPRDYKYKIVYRYKQAKQR